jgi:hypothetical protein
MINVLLSRSLLLLGLLFPAMVSYSQEGEEDTGKLPVRSTFETFMLIDNPTVTGPVAKQIQANIIHRFGVVNNGITDLFGIYAPSNIRMGLYYGITDRVMVGLGTTKDYKLQDLNWKVALLQQTRNGNVPLSISYYGNMVVDAREKASFGAADRYKELHRFSYVTEIIMARKFSESISLQVAPCFVYYNAVDTMYKNVNLGVSFGGRVKITDSKAIIFEYDQPLTKAKSDGFDAKPNLGVGLEIGTATHAFQVFASTAKDIMMQRDFVYNQNDLTKGDFLIGFNITIRF